jgi:flagellar basal body rod protein FlgG
MTFPKHVFGHKNTVVSARLGHFPGIFVCADPNFGSALGGSFGFSNKDGREPRPLATHVPFAQRKTMDNLTAVAASGMRSRMQALEVLANNLANSSSRGYKSDREIFTIYSSDDASNPAVTAGQQAPWVRDSWTDFTQGTLEPTGNPLDLALAGKGFLTMRGPSGNLYTRNGSLHLSATGDLLGPEDRSVLDNQNKPIRLDPAQPVNITATGEVQQQGATVAQLNIVEFSNPDTLSKLGQSYFQMTGATKPPVAAKETEVKQGVAESSNAVPSDAAVRLVSVLRQFEMLQKAITVGSDMNRRAMEEVARVNN